MHIPNFPRYLLLTSGLLFSQVSGAHGDGNEFDGCRLLLGGNPVRFSIRQPQFDANVAYCNAVPKLGTSVLEFSYEGVGPRALDVEFELNKEPEGRNVFRQAATPYPTGIAGFTVDLAEPGDYLGHVAITDAGGNKIDSHISFAVAKSRVTGSLKAYAVLGVAVAAITYLAYLSSASFKALVDRLLRR